MGVVFVNYGSESMVWPRAVALAEAGLAVVVVDNSGTFSASDPRVTVIDPGENLGFAAACNLGVSSFGSDVETLVFHNPDVDVSVADLGRLAVELERQARPGLVAPAELQGELLRPMGYHYPSVVREAVLGVRTCVKGPSTDAPAAHARGRASTSGRRFGSGALLLASRTALRQVGGFDERYFLYGEDLDLWHRTARIAEVSFSTSVTVTHLGGQGSDVGATTREWLRWLGLELFVELHGRRGEWRAHRAVHRAAAKHLLDNSPRWVAGILEDWRAGATPEQVQLRRRSELHERSLP